jgi:hypothetical protein
VARTSATTVVHRIGDASDYDFFRLVTVAVSIVTELRAGRQGHDSRQGQGYFLFATASRQGLWPTQPPIQWVPAALSGGVKWSGREVDQWKTVKTVTCIVDLPLREKRRDGKAQHSELNAIKHSSNTICP